MTFRSRFYLLTAGYRSRVTGGAGGVFLLAAGEQHTQVADHSSSIVPRTRPPIKNKDGWWWSGGMRTVHIHVMNHSDTKYEQSVGKWVVCVTLYSKMKGVKIIMEKCNFPQSA